VACDRCARCCQEFTFPLGGNKAWMVEMQAFLEFIRPDLFSGVPGGLRIHARCRHLDDGNRCVIYGERPDVCQRFLCSKARNNSTPT
jgi:Fe-S-cluster containining protein